MKATLEFNLPEETLEYKTVTKAVKMAAFIDNFEDVLRGSYMQIHAVTTEEVLDSLWKQFHDMKQEYNLVG